MRHSGILQLAMLILLAAPAAAQTAAPLTFEVASVKVATSGYNGYRGGCHGIDSATRPGPDEAPPPLGRCVITDARLSHLIGIALGVSVQDLSTGPDWIQRGDLRFDVNARAEDPATTTQKQLLTMLQNLLIERFQLKFHYRNTDAPGFSLTVAKNGPKLRESAKSPTSTGANPEVPPPLIFVLAPDVVRVPARDATTTELTYILQRAAFDRPVVDRTGLTARYDFDFEFSPDESLFGGALHGGGDGTRPGLFAAIQEQLGLKLEATRGLVDSIVIEKIDRPSEN